MLGFTKRGKTIQIVDRIPGKVKGTAFQSPDGTAGIVDLEFDESANPTVGDAVEQFLRKAGIVGLDLSKISIIRHGIRDTQVAVTETLVNGEVLSAVESVSVGLSERFRSGDRLALTGESGGG